MSTNAPSPRLPPSADDRKTGTLLAVVVHAVLLLALALGVSWRSSDPTPLSAELWAAVPRVAAPQPVTAPPPKPKIEAPKPVPPKTVEPQAQIATEKQPDKPRPVQRTPDDKAQRAEAERQRKLAEERERERQQQERLEQQREENLRRLASELSASAPTTSPGTAAEDAGPSASYRGRILARIKPNIIIADPERGHRIAEVELQVASDGRITSQRLSRPSGVAACDDAVVRAVERTGQLPLDEGGRAPPSTIVIEFNPDEIR